MVDPNEISGLRVARPAIVVLVEISLNLGQRQLVAVRIEIQSLIMVDMAVRKLVSDLPLRGHVGREQRRTAVGR